jgi:hypothetical protein
MLRPIYSRERNQLNRRLRGTKIRAGGFGGETNIFPLTKFEPRIVHPPAKTLYQLRNPESKSKCGLEKATCREALLSAVRFEYYGVNQSKQDETGQTVRMDMCDMFKGL